LVAAFHLLDQVFEALALALKEGSLTGSSLGSWAKTRMAGMRMSPLKTGMGEIKLSNASIQIKDM
jgi:hypothetical protein